MSNKELKELTDKSSLIFTVVVLTVIFSVSILFFLRFKTNISESVSSSTSFQITSNNVPTIQLGHYALWAVDSQESYTLIKRFNSVNNQLVGLDSETISTLESPLSNPYKFVVTIEKEGDREERPNNFILLSKEADAKRTELLFNDVELKDKEFSYILSTPTDGNDTINELSGLWFVKPDKTTASLDLPKLTDKWMYQTRIISEQNNIELSMGYFKDSASADSDARYSMTYDGYNFPGEDFFMNLPTQVDSPVNLANGKYAVMLSLEPYLDGTDITGDDVFLPIAYAKIPSGLSENTSEFMGLVYSPSSITIEFND